MRLFQHHVLGTAPRAAGRVAKAIVGSGRAEAGGGRLFGVFTPQIGLSNRHVVVLTEYPDEARARAGDLFAGLDVGVERHEFWEPDPRPAPGAVIAEADGFFSHRWWDIAEGDWERFRDLSDGAWGNFEDVHDTRVIGFWRSRTPPGLGLARVWLMAWYKNLAAWEGSRFYLHRDDARSAEAYSRFEARGALTLDSAVSLLRRVT